MNKAKQSMKVAMEQHRNCRTDLHVMLRWKLNPSFSFASEGKGGDRSRRGGDLLLEWALCLIIELMVRFDILSRPWPHHHISHLLSPSIIGM
mmetsp:Transcript_22665/g.65269  ORF Transcript_22665/g.65269 Transcript_22665/m.65269 type:complete len:92 (+) Transcript_22665:2218-2493(+)